MSLGGPHSHHHERHCKGRRPNKFKSMTWMTLTITPSPPITIGPGTCFFFYSQSVFYANFIPTEVARLYPDFIPAEAPATFMPFYSAL
jgi:hypothetical protein